jgi:hypothetical protein
MKAGTGWTVGTGRFPRQHRIIYGKGRLYLKRCYSGTGKAILLLLSSSLQAVLTPAIFSSSSERAHHGTPFTFCFSVRGLNRSRLRPSPQAGFGQQERRLGSRKKSLCIYHAVEHSGVELLLQELISQRMGSHQLCPPAGRLRCCNIGELC